VAGSSFLKVNGKGESETMSVNLHSVILVSLGFCTAFVRPGYDISDNLKSSWRSPGVPGLPLEISCCKSKKPE
jgi:hypothetical protein